MDIAKKTSNCLDIYYRFGCVDSSLKHSNYNKWCKDKVNINDINSYGSFKLCKNATTNGKTE